MCGRYNLQFPRSSGGCDVVTKMVIITFIESAYIVEWDLGGFPAWLLAIKPALTLRSSDPAFLQLVCIPYALYSL